MPTPTPLQLHRRCWMQDGCRGVGGTPDAPCTSVGEENLLADALPGGDTHFPHESILVHEFSHAVMNVGLSDADREAVSADNGLALCATHLRERGAGVPTAPVPGAPAPAAQERVPKMD